MTTASVLCDLSSVFFPRFQNPRSETLNPMQITNSKKNKEIMRLLLQVGGVRHIFLTMIKLILGNRGIVQLVERLLCKQKVRGSNPRASILPVFSWCIVLLK